MSTTFKFRATTPNLNVAIPGAKNGAQFRDHILVTSDANVADQLRGHACFGLEFTEETAALRAELAKVAADNPNVETQTPDGGDKPGGDKTGGDKKPDRGKPKGK